MKNSTEVNLLLNKMENTLKAIKELNKSVDAKLNNKEG